MDMTDDPQTCETIFPQRSPSILLEVYIAALYSRYASLSKVQQDITKKYKLERVSDQRFRRLKSKWGLIHDYLTKDATPPEHEQIYFLNNVLNAPEEHSSKSHAKDGENPGLMKTAKAAANAVTAFFGGSSSNNDPRAKMASLTITDPEFVSELWRLREMFPVLETITKQIQDRLAANLAELEKKVLTLQVQKITSGERRRQIDAASTARGAVFHQGGQEAFKILLSDLQATFTESP